MHLDASCAIATLLAIVVATLKILMLALAVATALVRLVGVLRSRRRRHHKRGRSHPQEHSLDDEVWLKRALPDLDFTEHASEPGEERECQLGQARR